MTGRLDLAGGVCARLRGRAHAFAGPSGPVSLVRSVISAAFLHDDLREPRGLGRDDRRSGHPGGKRTGGRLAR
jgi:hypothetical protein